jgi:hypothetical protein
VVALFKRWIRYSIVRKGGSSPLWTAIGVLSVLNTLRKKYAGRPVTSILSDGIRPGEVIEIRHTGKPNRAVRSERARKAAMLAQFVAAGDQASAKPGRKAKSTRRRFAGTVIDEMAQGHGGSTASSVTELLPIAAALVSSSEKPLSKRQLRRTTRGTAKFAKRVAKGKQATR